MNDILPRIITVGLLLQACLLCTPRAIAGPISSPDPGRNDTCPVCGMFVAKYPAWIATILFEGGRAYHFDGTKDLFKYLLDMPRT